ncbi:uncharacterized protein LOC143596596 [Bidens hawaiensis]|uniref:uncharacterized protein LOC143596596 n=1 Tax=Bidens hawaiensis TaxID=980011 RepID=UPI00404A1FEC
MVFIRFTGFILVLLLASLQSLSVHGARHQGTYYTSLYLSISIYFSLAQYLACLFAGSLIKETQQNDSFLKKASNKGFEPVQEHVVETLAIGSGSNVVRIRGRKMAMMLKEDERMGSRSSTGEVQKLKVEADMHASKQGPQDLMNNQGQENKSEKMAISPSQSSLKHGFSRSSATPSSFSTNKLSPYNHQSGEWKKLLEDADKKVMQMMKRDYGGMKRPRHKPPINNHEPGN